MNIIFLISLKRNHFMNRMIDCYNIFVVNKLIKQIHTPCIIFHIKSVSYYYQILFFIWMEKFVNLSNYVEHVGVVLQHSV